MAQISGFWDGTTVGDATLAAYDSLEFGGFYSRTLASHGPGYVVPGYLSDLRVKAQNPVSAIVEVLAGAAYVKGFHYKSDATEPFTIAANASGNPRIDRIVLRADWTAKTVRLAMLAGTPAATPSLPALTQIDGTTWEVSLAYIWVANGFATIADTEIHEERVFAITSLGVQLSEGQVNNLLVNSEFMACTGFQFGAAADTPEEWDVFGTAPTIANATKPAQMARGRYVQMTAGGANRGIKQTIKVTPSTPYAFKSLMNVTAGDVGEFNITTNSGAPVGLTRTIRRTGVDLEETMYYTTESDATTLTFSEYCVNNTDIVKVGQTVAAQGYYPGPFRQIKEILALRSHVGDTTNWTFANAKSDQNTTIDLTTAAWGNGNILPGTRAIYLGIEARDAGSAAAAFTACFMGASHTGASHAAGQGFECEVLVRLGGITNDVVRGVVHGWVPLNATPTFDLVVQATGAGTLDTQPRIMAIET